jgi:hypothetical protein
MADTSKDKSFDEILRNIGPDATATFDNSPSNPTEYASSEATNAATAVEGEDEDLTNEDLDEEDDDDAAIEEEDDEENEGEDVEDEANL